MNKRGEESSKQTLVLAIIIIASVSMLLAWQLGAFEKGDEDAKETLCRQSIKFHNLLVRSSGEHSAPSIECEPHVVSVEENAQKAIAEELEFCWERWQQGEVQLFVTEGSYCNPCSIITLNTELSGMHAYMESEGYADKLFPHKTEGYAVPREDEEQWAYSFAPGKYAVVFLHDKNHSTKKLHQVIGDDPLQTSKAAEKVLLYSGSGAAAGGTVAAALAWAGPPGWIVGAGITGVGGLIGGMTGGAVVVTRDIPYPEWFSVVLVIPHDGEEYKKLGCDDVYQQGVPEMVGGAENI